MKKKKNCTYVNSEGFVSGYQYCGIYPLICGGGCDWGGGWCVCIWGGLWSQCGGFWSHGAWVGGLKPKFFKEISKKKKLIKILIQPISMSQLPCVNLNFKLRKMLQIRNRLPIEIDSFDRRPLARRKRFNFRMWQQITRIALFKNDRQLAK